MSLNGRNGQLDCSVGGKRKKSAPTVAPELDLYFFPALGTNTPFRSSDRGKQKSAAQQTSKPRRSHMQSAEQLQENPPVASNSASASTTNLFPPSNGLARRSFIRGLGVAAGLLATGGIGATRS